MNSSEINSLLKNKKNFIGVFALDKLPNTKINLPASLIINNDVSSENGEHWLSLVLTKKQAFYFDSFGLSIVDKQILDFLSVQKFKKIIYSTKCIQSINSNKCGHFCILFVKIVKNTKKYVNFLDLFFEKPLFINDCLVIEYLKL